MPQNARSKDASGKRPSLNQGAGIDIGGAKRAGLHRADFNLFAVHKPGVATNHGKADSLADIQPPGAAFLKRALDTSFFPELIDVRGEIGAG